MTKPLPPDDYVDPNGIGAYFDGLEAVIEHLCDGDRAALVKYAAGETDPDRLHGELVMLMGDWGPDELSGDLAADVRTALAAWSAENRLAPTQAAGDA